MNIRLKVAPAVTGRAEAVQRMKCKAERVKEQLMLFEPRESEEVLVII